MRPNTASVPGGNALTCPYLFGVPLHTVMWNQPKPVEAVDKVMKMRWQAGLAALMVIFLITAPLTAVLAEEKRIVRVGVLGNFPPHYVTEKEFGASAGFAVDIITDIAREAKLDLRFLTYRNWKELIDAVRTGQIDIVPLLPVNTETIAAFNLTSILYTAPMSIFVRNDNSDLRGNSDLPGRRVSVVSGDIGERIMQSYRGELSITHQTVEDALYAVISRTSHALLFQDEVLLQHARPLGLATLIKPLQPPLHEVRFAVAVTKSDFELFSTLQPIVEAYLGSDAFTKARTTWIGNPSPRFDLKNAMIFAAILLAISVTAVGLWRYVSVLRLNKALALSIAEREAAEARFRDHAEAASDWFFELDNNLRFTFLSPAFEKAIGITSQSLIGKTQWYGENPPESAEERASLEAYADLVETHRNWRDLIFTLRTSAGEKRIISTSGKAIFDERGQFAGYRGIGRDVTRRIETEQSLHQAQKLETIGKLTGGIAHDFNNLLMVLTGNLEMLKKHVRTDKPERSFLDISSEAVDLGTKLTQRLLAFSRRQSLDPEKLDLNELVNDLRGLLHTSIGESIDFTIKTGPGIPPVLVDKSQMQIALLNLSLNARDAMPHGGRLCIETEVVEVDQAFARAHAAASVGRYVALYVRDSGSGIDPAILRKVVEPFFTTKAPADGTGLGLSSVYGFVKQSGGFLIIDSVVNEGTTASIYLSCPPGEEIEDAETETDRAAPRTNGELILTVEDNPRVREVTVIRLEDLGYRVLQAGSAPEALGLIRDHDDIALLFTDIVMPGASGIELAREARTLRPDLKVLFTTGYAEEMSGMTENGPWLPKPYKQSELAHKLRDVLGPVDNYGCGAGAVPLVNG